MMVRSHKEANSISQVADQAPIWRTPDKIDHTKPPCHGCRLIHQSRRSLFMRIGDDAAW
jgi:hypothetical protein